MIAKSNRIQVQNKRGFIVAVLVAAFCVLLLNPGVADPFDQNGAFKYPETMEVCKDGRCMGFVLTVLLVFIGASLFQSIVRTFPRLGLAILWLLFISSVAYLMTEQTLETLFEYVKFFSIGVGAIIVSTYRILAPGGTPGRRKFFSILAYSLLALNIAEAVVGDVLDKKYFNAITGALLVFLMPRPEHFLSNEWGNVLFIDQKRDFVYTTPMSWVLLYTSWNLCFSYSERREHFATIVAVLAAALCSDLPNSLTIDPHLYIQARAYTLFARYMVLGFRDVYQEHADSSLWFREDIAQYWGLFNLVAGLVLVGKTKLTATSSVRR